jgi:bifunctional non-homologous end joining protein LigD
MRRGPASSGCRSERSWCASSISSAAAIRYPATYFAFDLLSFGDFDLRGRPLVDRKRELAAILPPAGPLRYADHVLERGVDFYGAVEAMKLEGMLAKRADSVYRPGRSEHWRKIRADQPRRVRDHRHVATAGRAARVRSAASGRLPKRRVRGARAGLRRARGHRVQRRAARATASPAAGEPAQDSAGERADPGRRRWPGTRPVGPDEVWVEPELVCEVRYKEWTEEGCCASPRSSGCATTRRSRSACCPPSARKRSPVTGRRDVESDLAESDHATAASEGRPRSTPGTRSTASRRSAATVPLPESRTGARELKLSNRNKVFWPRDGYTKGDLIDYYRTIAPAMLPWLRDRPLVLTRLPDGIDGQTNFYQKNAPSHAPDWIQTETDLERRRRPARHRVLRGAGARRAGLHGEPRRDRAPRLVEPPRDHRAPLTGAFSTTTPRRRRFRDVSSRSRSPLHELCDEIGMPKLREDQRLDRLHARPASRSAPDQLSSTPSQIGELISRVIARDHPKIANRRTRDQEARRQGHPRLQCRTRHGQLLVAPLQLSARSPRSAGVGRRSSGARSTQSCGSRLDDRDRADAGGEAGSSDPWEGMLDLEPDLPAILGT